MTTFTIDAENNITAHATAAEAKTNPEAARFTSAKELSKLAIGWPASRMVEIWNSLPAQTPVKKFTSREKAVTRIWAAIQVLVHAAGTEDAPEASKKTKRSSAAPGPPTALGGSKTAIVLELLKRPGGATLQDIMSATGWQAHSVRGFVSGTLGTKMGLTVASAKGEDGARTYSIAT